MVKSVVFLTFCMLICFLTEMLLVPDSIPSCRPNPTRRPASADRTARHQFQATGQPVSRTQASDAMTHGCRAMRQSVCNAGASNVGRSLCIQISRERSYPVPIYWYHSKGNWLHYYFAAASFYIKKLCSRLFVVYCQNCPKEDKFRYFIPILRKLRAV